MMMRVISRVVVVALAFVGAASIAFCALVFSNRSWRTNEEALLGQIISMQRENDRLHSDMEASHREALIAQGFAPAPLVIDGGVITCKLTSRDTVKANGQTFRIPEGDGAIVVDSAAGTIVRDPSLRPEECE